MTNLDARIQKLEESARQVGLQTLEAETRHVIAWAEALPPEKRLAFYRWACEGNDSENITRQFIDRTLEGSRELTAADRALLPDLLNEYWAIVADFNANR